MNLKMPNLLKTRATKIVLELVLIIIIYMLLKTWMQRSMIEGDAPEITAQLLDGTPVSLQSHRGKPVLLHFWASWCGICKMEQDSIESINKDYRVISVALKSGKPAEVQQYMQNHKLAFATINDPDGAISATYGVGAVPASFVLDPKGSIKFKETGYTTEWGLRFRLWLARD